MPHAAERQSLPFHITLLYFLHILYQITEVYVKIELKNKIICPCYKIISRIFEKSFKYFRKKNFFFLNFYFQIKLLLFLEKSIENVLQSAISFDDKGYKWQYLMPLSPKTDRNIHRCVNSTP